MFPIDERMGARAFLASPYVHDVDRPSFDCFPPDTVSADSTVFIHVPVKEEGECAR